jgi:phosphoadenosine phosphosulfate reductase
VLFVDTGKHFGETRRYRDELVARLGLADVRVIEPDPAAVDADDPQGILWSQEPDRCCFVRKVAPLKRALAGFDA